jgi:hypothetical protein
VRRPALVALGLALLVTAAVLTAQFGRGRGAPDPFPSPRNPDPAGTLAFQMLLGRRGVPAQVRRGLPREPGATLLWFAQTPRPYSGEEVENVLAWVRRGGHLLLVCGGPSLAPPPPVLRDLGLGFEPSLLSDPVPAQASPFAGVTLRPSAFLLRGGDIRVRGLSSDGRPCWVSGCLGRGTWAALADSFPFENEGLGREGNACFALGLAGDRPFVDESLFEAGPAGGTLGSEPLFWGALLQFALLGGLLLLSLRRLGPPLARPVAAGSPRLRAGIAHTLAEKRSLGELLDLEITLGSWSRTEGETLRSLARSGDWVGAYRRVRRRIVKGGCERP